MAIEKHIKINVDTKGAVKSFDKLGDTIQEQKDITIEFEKELHRLEQQLLNTSKGNLAQQKATKDRIVSLKGALKDQRLSLKELNNERGKANKVTEINTTSLSKNYGVVQLLDQVTGGLASQVRSVVDANRLFNISLKGTRAALIATGVGAFVVALGLIVAYWDEIVEFTTKANENLEYQKKLTQDSLDLSTEKLKTLKLEAKLLGNSSKLLGENVDKQKKLLTFQLGSALAKQKEKEEALALLKIEAEQELFEIRAAGRRSKRLGAATQTEFTKETQERIAALSVESEKAKQSVLELTQSIIDLLKDPEEDEAAKGDGIERGQQENVLEDGLTFEDNITLGSKNLLNELLEDADITFKKNQSIRDEKALNEVAANAEREKQYKEDVKNATIGLAVQTFNILGALAEEGSALAKGVAVAQATIDTYKGAVAAYAAGLSVGGPAGLVIAPIAAGLTVAAGLVNISKILATKPVSTTAPSGGAGGRAPAPPSFNLVQGTASNQINDSLQTQEPVRAIVVSRDVTSAQEANRNSENNSTL